MTSAEAMRALREAGWRLVRHSKGSHAVMQKGARRLIVDGRDGKHPLSPGQRALVLRATRRAKR